MNTNAKAIPINDILSRSGHLFSALNMERFKYITHGATDHIMVHKSILRTHELAFMASLLSNILKGQYVYCIHSTGTLALRIP